MNEDIDAFFSRIDGELFRRQRLFLLELADDVSNDPVKEGLVEGLLNLTDAVADIAHDHYGIECLLTEDDE